ncbi:hypothetical protein [Nonomuraea basaltis]|uniref:hypothetical protein n=1 Tax=Nonomuraea basaltis TaxID=2495887 RepID=UPI00110C5AC5|nr:hypothetical protein [Nonomuraea basaltis]TMR98699.1 hypothetical protein EJK15_11215 [Nonomuraea basaltis]
MTGYEIASGAVGREGTNVGDQRTVYDAALQRLSERGYGSLSWGDDGLFGTFAAAYAACTQVSLTALTGVSGELDGTGQGLTGVARNARDTEDFNAEDVGGITWA